LNLEPKPKEQQKKEQVQKDVMEDNRVYLLENLALYDVKCKTQEILKSGQRISVPFKMNANLRYGVPLKVVERAKDAALASLLVKGDDGTPRPINFEQFRRMARFVLSLDLHSDVLCAWFLHLSQGWRVVQETSQGACNLPACKKYYCYSPLVFVRRI
jgi:hypothetical protein